MAIKNIISSGIGFNPTTLRFIITHGFSLLGGVGALGDPDVVDLGVAQFFRTLELKADL